jgi:hypothetical protein
LRIKLIMRKFEFEADVSFHVVSEEVWVWNSSEFSWGSLSLKLM